MNTRVLKEHTELYLPLLLFLLGVTYVKLYIKIAAVICYALYLVYKRCKFPRINRIHLFYISITLLGVLSSFINRSFSHPEYTYGFTIGIIQWFIAFVSSYLLVSTFTFLGRERFLKVLKYFYGINALVSIGVLLLLFTKTNFTFPYWYDAGGKYGVSTGDYINGVFSDTSFVNAAISSVGVLFFLINKQYKWAVLCTIIMLLCTSNVSVIFLAITLLVMFVFKNNYPLRKNIVFILLLMIASYPVLSPQNLAYMEVAYEREKSSDYEIGKEKLTEVEGLQPSLVVYGKSFFKKNIHSEFRSKDYYGLIKSYRYQPYFSDHIKPVWSPLQFYKNIDNYRINTRAEDIMSISGELPQLYKSATEESDLIEDNMAALNPYSVQQAIAGWYNIDPESSTLSKYQFPGKVYSYEQTLYFLRSNYTHLLLGAGIGNFSSKLAVKMTGLKIQGNYPDDKIYVSKNFLQYHFYTILYYFSRHASEHSILNMPNSVYNQLGGEYGLLGLLCFILLYLGFLLKHKAKLNAGVFISVILMMFLGMDYWFEYLSLVIVFDAIIFSEIYSKKLK